MKIYAIKGGHGVPMWRARGVKVPHLKSTEDSSPRRIPVPERLILPMSMHIGAPARPMVAVGDTVRVGQPVAEGVGPVSAPIHSGVSGTVKAIEDFLLPSGQRVPAIMLESDGEQTPWEGLAAPQVTDLASFQAAVRASGVVGLGGAGFPTATKLAVKDLSQIDTLLVNGAECEPYITSDTRTMLDETALVLAGIELVQQYLKIPAVIIGIEANKPRCIKAFEALCAGKPAIAVKALPPLYPQGGEKVLVLSALGRIIPEGKLPLDVGALVLNCTTLAAIARYIQTGMPLVEKCVTVAGPAVREPQNVRVPVGTPLKDVFAFCGGFSEEPRKVLYGGPMMGIAAADLDSPVLKSTNAILAFGEKDAAPPPETACIRCGKCIDHCPLNLMPCDIETAFRRKDGDSLAKLKVNLCMECGCCAYICPARRPLVQTHKLAKGVLRAYQSEKKAREEGVQP